MFETVQIKKIVPAKNNYRKTFDEKAMEELTASIKAKGVLQPILVRPNGKKGHYEIVAGHRRHRAAEAAGLKEIPVMVKELSDEEALEVQVIENSQREDPNPMDEAWGFKHLLEMGKHTPETLAAKIDHSVAYVLGRIRLADLDEKVQEKIASGEISMGHALLFTRLKNHGDQKKLLDAITEDDGLTVKAAKEQLRDFTHELKDAPFDTKACATCAYRFRNQVTLFPDLKKTDQCMDASCFMTKTKAHFIAWLEEKKTAGFKTFTDAKKIEKLVEYNAKTSRAITAERRPGVYNHNYSIIPKKYKTECAKCVDNRAFFMHEVKDWPGLTIETGEICLDTKCLDKMQRGKTEKTATSCDEDRNVNSHTLTMKARDCRDRFLVNAIPLMVADSEILRKRLVICHIAFEFMTNSGGEEINDLLKAFNPGFKGREGYYFGQDKLYKGIAGIPAADLDDVIKKLLIISLPATDEDVLLQMTPEAGIDFTKETLIDKEYLNGKTKDELFSLIKEIGLDAPSVKSLTASSKKDALISAILLNADDLIGKIPADIAEVIKLDTEEESEDANNEFMDDDDE